MATISGPTIRMPPGLPFSLTIDDNVIRLTILEEATWIDSIYAFESMLLWNMFLELLESVTLHTVASDVVEQFWAFNEYSRLFMRSFKYVMTSKHDSGTTAKTELELVWY